MLRDGRELISEENWRKTYEKLMRTQPDPVRLFPSRDLAGLGVDAPPGQDQVGSRNFGNLKVWGNRHLQ